MSLTPTGSQPDRTKQGATREAAIAAKDSLGKKLSDQGIKIGIGVELLGNSTYGVTLRVQPVHGVSAKQLAELRSIEVHEGVPVSLRQSSDLKPRE